MTRYQALPTCEKCGGSGYIYSTQTVGSNVYEFAEECTCVTNQRALGRFTGLSESELTFETYAEFEEWQKVVKRKAIAYADDPQGWFVILGVSGSGKTHICTAIARRIMEKHKILYIKNDVLRKLKFDTDESELEKYKSVPFLYIDDFLKGNTSDAEMKIAYEIINERYFRDLPTIISSERTIKELLDIDMAIGGRIKEKAGENLLDLGVSVRRNYRLGGKK